MSDCVGQKKVERVSTCIGGRRKTRAKFDHVEFYGDSQYKKFNLVHTSIPSRDLLFRGGHFFLKFQTNSAQPFLIHHLRCCGSQSKKSSRCCFEIHHFEEFQRDDLFLFDAKKYGCKVELGEKRTLDEKREAARPT